MKAFDDAHVHVGFEQREADLACDLVDVAFRSAARERSRVKMPSSRSLSASNTGWAGYRPWIRTVSRLSHGDDSGSRRGFAAR